MKSNVKTCVLREKLFPFATFCSMESSQVLDECIAEEGSGLICSGLLRGVVSKDCRVDEITQYIDISQLFNWIWLSHLNGSLELIDNKMMKGFVFSALDFAAYFINTPKIADDFEMIKFLF